jgi:hypothetical protein
LVGNAAVALLLEAEVDSKDGLLEEAPMFLSVYRPTLYTFSILTQLAAEADV